MRSFDFTRFGSILLKDITDYRKFYIQTTGIFAAVILFLAVVSLFLDRSITSLGYVSSAVSIINTATFIWFTTCLAFIVSNITGKRERIADFMIPATKLEKFTARWFHLIILIPLAAFVGILVSDLVQMLMSAIVLGETRSVIGYFFHTTNLNAPMLSGSALNGYSQLAGAFYINSLFLICGTIFRRYAWIKSCIVMAFMSMVLLIIAALIFKSILDLMYGAGNYDIELSTAWWVQALWYGFTILFGVFNYWLAFRIYSRMQVAANRWHNL